MLRHEIFQELCAAASVGQASAEELRDLEQHALECVECREAYERYLQFAAANYAASGGEPQLSPEQARQCITSPLFEQRFFEMARREGIMFSAEADSDIRKTTSAIVPFAGRPHRRTITGAIAAALLLGIIIPSTYYLGKTSSVRVVAARPRSESQPDNRTASLDRRIADLSAQNADLGTQVENLKEQLRQVSDVLNSKDAVLQASASQRNKLTWDRDVLAAQLRAVQFQLSDSQARLTAARQEAAKLKGNTDEMNASLIAAQLKINDLSAELKTKSELVEQERQLLALRHDVTDLMGARNLHIVDVVDTDQRGRTRAAFGRIFFTEGKSLVFYAYDLNEPRIEKAGYQYRVWAKKEGDDRQVKSLGIFYSDDKSQRRWVYKCNDPKILNEIDSVFVTLERTNANGPQPKGPSLMYAYLRGQPNHP